MGVDPQPTSGKSDSAGARRIRDAISRYFGHFEDVVYVGLAQLFGRSSWAVLGALGVLIAAGEFTLQWTHIRVPLLQPEGTGGRGWVPPLVFGFAGALLVLLGLMAARRHERAVV